MAAKETSVLFVGHSHLGCIAAALKENPLGPRVEVVNLTALRLPAGLTVPEVAQAVIERATLKDPDVLCLCMGGNHHNVLGVIENPQPFTVGGIAAADQGARRQPIPEQALREHFEQHAMAGLIHGLYAAFPRARRMYLNPPPPVGDFDHIRNNPGVFADKIDLGPVPPELRLKLYQIQTEVLRGHADKAGAEFIVPGPPLVDARGFLADDCYATDPTHGNARYGAAMLAEVMSRAAALASKPKRAPVTEPETHPATKAAARPAQTGAAQTGVAPVGSSGPATSRAPRHPYVGLPDRQFWKKDPGIMDPAALDPVSDVPFTIGRNDRIVTAGSCFAQHVARFMTDSGFNHHITETAHPILSPKIAQRHNYGLFAARYGNLYTARQLLQLVERAFGRFEPLATAWPGKTPGTFVDPFRPQIQPGGFLSEAELIADREHHLACVRRAIEEMDVFVFTLGLTEGWADTRDGAVFPLAPGVAGGDYDPETVTFVNFDEAETFADLSRALEAIRAVNPTVRIILTVSPVPLNATYEDRHVLVSTNWSKAVLRIAAEKARRSIDDCVYFPSYDIITSPHVRGAYYAEDRREVTEQGVDHVMQLFLRHFGAEPGARPAPAQTAAPARAAPASAAQRHLAEMQARIEVLCDEESIDNA